MSVIKKFGYKNYSGPFFDRNYRIWQICWFNLKERIWNQKSVIATFSILLFVSFIVIIPLAFITSSGGGLFVNVFLQGQTTNIADFFVSAYGLINFVIISNPLTFILFGFIGGKIISEDIEYKSLEQYFLRVRRTDYLLGKFLALFLSYFLSMFFISFLFYYFLTSAFGYGLFDFEPLLGLVRIVLFLLIMTVTFSLLMLAISGATEKKNYASLIFILLLLVIGDIFKIFAFILDSEIYLLFNPQEIIAVILQGFTPIDSDISNFAFFLGLPGGLNTTVSFFQALLVVTTVSFGSFIFVIYKIKRIWN